MLDSLLNLVRDQADDAIINNPAIPNENNEEAIATTSQAMTGGLQEMLAGGQFKDVLKMFTGNAPHDMSNPVVQQLSGNTGKSLMDRFGLDAQTAGGMASNLVPNVLGKLIGKANDPNDSSIDLHSILNKLSNGKTQGLNLQSLLSKLDQDGDGDTDLQDVMAMFGGNKKAGGGSMMDSVKGLFGN